MTRSIAPPLKKSLTPKSLAAARVSRAGRSVLMLALVMLAGCVATAAEPAAEDWAAFYLGDAKVGYGHNQCRVVEEEGRKLYQVESSSQLTMNRLGQTVTIEMKVGNAEEANGDLVRFDSEVKLANMPMKAKGTVADGKLTIEASVQGRVAKTTIDCPAGTRGIDALDRSLAAKPMKPGEERHLKMLMPMFNVIADVHLTAADYEETELLGGEKRRLLRIENEARVPGQGPLRSTVWADASGTQLKSVERGGLTVTTYRTTREIALGAEKGAPPDLISLSIVKPEPAPNDPHAADQVIYRLKLADGDPAKVFPSGPSQRVKSVGENEAEVAVMKVRPASDIGGIKIEPPGDGDRNSNVLIQSDDSKVVELAKEVAADEKDPWKLAVALEKHVRDSMKMADFSQALASAAEVARTRRGDCTEYSVLLAALARARGLPARVVVGLVYVPALDGFGFHMWNEVWIKDRWIPLDATLGKGGIGGGHLKLADANLADGSPTNFLPVYQVIGKLRINTVEEKKGMQ